MKLKELLGAGADAANKKTDKSNKKNLKLVDLLLIIVTETNNT